MVFAHWVWGPRPRAPSHCLRFYALIPAVALAATVNSFHCWEHIYTSVKAPGHASFQGAALSGSSVASALGTTCYHVLGRIFLKIFFHLAEG